MNKIFIVFFCMLIPLSACTKKPKIAPEAVVESYTKAVQTGDIEKVIIMENDIAYGSYIKAGLDKESISFFKNCSFGKPTRKSLTDNSAVVDVDFICQSDFDNITRISFILKNIKRQWVITEFENDASFWTIYNDLFYYDEIYDDEYGEDYEDEDEHDKDYDFEAR